MHIFIGGAWPYANGSLHLGRAAGILPGDVLARYHRLKGDDVLYVSGSDCHGTPISILASQENVPPSQIADRYHAEFVECFSKLGFSYDLYTRTDDAHHHNVVKQLFLQLVDQGTVYGKQVEQTYCTECSRFLPDRYVEGSCPHCGQTARGDQCDHCSSLLDPIDLQNKICKLCGNHPEIRHTDHYFLALSKFQNQLEAYLQQAVNWRSNALDLTKRYLNEGLVDRAATRDLDWGVDVPLPGYEGKKIYVWIEAVSGYLSASMKWSEDTGEDWKPFWDDNAKSYYVHGKDNIPFHSLILPSLLMGSGVSSRLPNQIVSSEYLTLEGKKFSTSRNWAVWVPYLLEHYHPDTIRYFLIMNGPENRDTDFSWREFIYSHNGELLGAFGNFVNRSLVFVDKFLQGEVPKGTIDLSIKNQLKKVYCQAGDYLEAGKLKAALECIFSFIRNANKYFDERKPWIQVKEQLSECETTLHTCIQIIANLVNLLFPFLPFSCRRIQAFLHLQDADLRWDYIELASGRQLNKPEALFERIEISRIQEEVDRLHDQLS